MRERHREHKSKEKLSLNNAGGLYCIWVALWIIIGKREKRRSDRKTDNLSPLKWRSVMILRIQYIGRTRILFCGGDFQALVFPAGIVVQLFAGNAAQQSFLIVVNSLILHFDKIFLLRNLPKMLGKCFCHQKQL